jgi:hypothetical protein
MKNPSLDIGMDGRSLAHPRERPHVDIAGFHLHMNPMSVLLVQT